MAGAPKTWDLIKSSMEYAMSAMAQNRAGVHLCRN